MKKLTLALLLIASPLLAQHQPRGEYDGNHPRPRDYYSLPTAPTTCTVGDAFFDTDATAGSNWYACTTANTWTAQTGDATSLATANTWTENQTIELDNFACFGATTGGCIGQASAQTVDTVMLLTGTTSEAYVMAQYGDRAFDFAHAAATTPTLFIHSATQGTTEWVGFTHNATNAVYTRGTGIHSFDANVQTVGTVVGFGSTTSNVGTFYPLASAQTPDGPLFGMGTTSGALIFAQDGDKAFDFAHAAVTNPALYIHSATQSTTEFVGISHNVGGAVINNQGTVTLTEAGAAQTVLTLTTADTQITGGTLFYSVRIQDTAATPDDNDIRQGHFQFGMANSAGVVICTADASDQTNDDSFITQQGVAKTITYAIAVTAGTNTCVFSFDIDSDMTTVTGASITYTLVLNGPGILS
jgi:hypothetical protein